MAALLASPHSGLESPFARLLHQRARQGRQPPGNRRRHHPHSMAMAEVCAGKDAEHKNGEDAGPLQPLDDAPKSLRVASWRTQEVERSKQRAEIEDAHKAQRDEIKPLWQKRRKHEAKAKGRKKGGREKAEAERKKAEAERKPKKKRKSKRQPRRNALDRQKLLERQLIEKGGDTMRLSVGRGLRTAQHKTAHRETGHCA